MVEVTTTMCGIIHRQAAGSLDRRRGTIGAALISYLIITYANATRLQSTPHWMEQRIIHTELGVTKTMDNLSGDIIGESTTDVYEGCDTYYDYATRNLRDPSLPCNEIDADDVKEVDPEIIDVSEQYQHKWDMEKIQMKYQDRESTGESVQFYVPLEGNTERHLQVLPRYGMLDDRVSDFCGMDSLALQEIEFELCKSQVRALLRFYDSFDAHAWRKDKQNETPPIQLVTIIGVQKGGTTNLRWNLLTHPSISGMPREVHFFDRYPHNYPTYGQWTGDARDAVLNPAAARKVLLEYATACLAEGIHTKEVGWESALSEGAIVESCPRYMLSPIVPYRMKMVRPQARLIALLRDPTERYFSQLRMTMCQREPYLGFSSSKQMIDTWFHLPGQAADYFRRAEEAYQPYTTLCRGENATSADLWACFERMEPQNPLHRGLYADQLERWFMVFPPSQVLIIDSAEMFADFPGTLRKVAEFSGLPPYEFAYHPGHEFKGECSEREADSASMDYFTKGGRYEQMLEDRALFKQWYQSHNERLFRLLGRNLGWND